MTDLHVDEWIAAYALGALDLDTAERVHSHLGACTRCRDLTLRALHTACALPFSLPLYSAPSELKTRVLRSARDSAGHGDSAADLFAAKAAAANTAPPDRGGATAKTRRAGISATVAWT
ncbi:MAG: anti-sigma factor family protein, partial [Chloroflexota bacterium]